MKTQTLKLLILVLMASCVGTGSLFGQITLNGNYTIGSSGNADFSTIKQVLDTIASATFTGDVVFTVESGTYNDVLILDAANNGPYSITFQGEDKETTIIQPDGQYNGSGFYMYKVSHFIFRDFTYEMDSISKTKVSHTSDITRGFVLKNTSDVVFNHLDIINSRHEGFDASSWDDYIASTFSMDSVADIDISNSLISGAGIHVLLNWFDNVNIENNYFENGQTHVLSYNSSVVGAGGLTIRDNVMNGPIATSRSMINIIGNGSSFPLSTSYTNNIAIENNIIDCVERYNSQYGVFMEYVAEVSLNNNIIKNGHQAIRSAALENVTLSNNYLNSSLGPAVMISGAKNTQITNNFVEADNQTMELTSSNGISFISNTLKTTGTWGMYCNYISGSFEIKNNIFDADTNCAYQLRIDNPADDILDMDYNSFSTAIPECIRVYNYTHNGDPISDLYYSVSDWKAAQPYFDQNSKQLTHTFRSPTDMHIDNDSLYRFGIPYAGLEYDYDYDLRDSTVGIDIGADQYVIDTLEFDFSEITLINGYCRMLGDSHEICFGSNLVDDPKNTFQVHSTEDDNPSDFQLFNLQYRLDSGNITVQFDLYNKYNWQSIEETYFLPEPGDRDSSNIVLTKRDTNYSYVEMPFHFIVRKLNDEPQDTTTSNVPSKVISHSVQVYPNPSTSGTFEIRSEFPLQQIIAYDLLGNEVGVGYSKTAKGAIVHLPSSGMYFLNISTSENQLTQRVIVLER